MSYDNETDLCGELKVTAMADHLMKSFIQTARSFNAKLPRKLVFTRSGKLADSFSLELSWNFKGAFVGKVVDRIKPDPAEGSDKWSLRMKDFLATPLLRIGPDWTEERFSGMEDFRPNTSDAGLIADAYGHFCVLETHKTWVICDLQGKDWDFH
jgi:myosin-heavy-chain kinase